MSLVDILNAILPVYLLIALGFVAVLLGWFPKASIPGVGRFVRNFALPSAVFLVVVQRDISDVVHPGFMLAFGLASILSFGISLTLARRMGGTAPEVHGILAIAGSMSNGLMIGIPLISGLFGASALAAIAQQVVIENTLVLPMGLALAELAWTRKQHQGSSAPSPLVIAGRTLWSTLTNPLVAALLLGLLVSLSGLTLPIAVERSVDMLATSLSGIALVFIGLTLYGTDLRAAIRGVLPAVAIKNAFHPLMMALTFWTVMLVWKAMGWMPVPATYANAAVVIASLPTIGALPAIAARFGQEQPMSLAVLVMTLISALTTPLTVWLVVTYQPFA